MELAEQLSQFLERPSTNLPSICPFIYERKTDDISAQILKQHLYIMTLVWHNIPHTVRNSLKTKPAGKALKEFKPRENAAIVLASRLDMYDQLETAKRLTRNTPEAAKVGVATSTSTYQLSSFLWQKSREISSVRSDDGKRHAKIMNEACAVWDSWRGGGPALGQDNDISKALVREFDIARGLTQQGKDYSAARTEFLGLNSEGMDADRIARMVEEIYFFDRGRGRIGGESAKAFKTK